jgi:hypothetical protein
LRRVDWGGGRGSSTYHLPGQFAYQSIHLSVNNLNTSHVIFPRVPIIISSTSHLTCSSFDLPVFPQDS